MSAPRELALRDYQEAILGKLRQAFIEGHKSVVLVAPTGAGKCLGYDTPVLMADGSIRPAQDIVAGDALMGPDGKPRNVLSVASGREMLYRVIPTKGDPYVVNASHILSLRLTPGSDGLTLSDGTRVGRGDDVVNVNVETYARSNMTARHCLKGWRAPAIQSFLRDQDEDEEDRVMPAYILGAWLGDGTQGHAAISKPACKMVDAWIAYGKSVGLGVRNQAAEGECPTWLLSNGRDGYSYNLVLGRLAMLGVARNRHVPDCYKFGPLEVRRAVLAGLVDSDGHITHGGCDWISKSERLAHDFAFLCRSVGLACYVSRQRKTIPGTGFEGWYWRASVSGDLSELPMLDKVAAPRQQKKRHLVHGIRIEPLEVGDYYGFEIDGDHLFLLGDFTVTHNTEMAMALLGAAADKGNRAAMILDRIVLCNQTSARLDTYGMDHGVMQAGHWRFRPGERIQVCSAQTLEKRGSMPGMKLLVVDECHNTRKQTVEFIKNNPGIMVVGLTATPFTKGLGRIYSAVVSAITTSELVAMGNLAPLRVFIAKEIDMAGAKKVAGEWSSAEAEERGIKITGDVVAEWVKKTHEVFGRPRKTVVFAAGVKHAADLAQKFSDAGYNFVSLSYKDDDEFKAEAIKEFSKPDSSIVGLIATDILTKGFDVPDVMIGVSARPFTKSLSSHIQQMGRVMRSHPDKEFALWLDHSGNYLRFAEDWEDIYANGVNVLDDGKEKPKKEPTQEEKEAAKCPRCNAFWPGRADACACCGFIRPRRNNVTENPGELTEYSPTGKKLPAIAERQQFFSELMGMAEIRGYKRGWAFHKYREKFGVDPKGLSDAPAEPGAAVQRWVRSRQIAWANSRKNVQEAIPA